MKAVTISLMLMTAFGCDDDDDDHRPPDAPQGPGTILEVARANPALEALVAAVQFASDDGDLAAVLDGPGPLTVFAPTNAAFDALAVELTGDPEARAAALLTEANKPLLRSVLQYHVVEGELRAADIRSGFPITTVEGSVFKIEAGPPPVIVDGRNREARIVETDIEAENGVVHVIDRVLLPPDRTIAQRVEAADAPPAELSILYEAIEAAGLEDELSGPGPLTLFAPTDAAFTALLAELGLTKPQLLANVPLLTKVLTYHLVERRLLEAEIPIGTPITTVKGSPFTVGEGGVITDERGRTARIVETDLFATNGVIHVIDRVLLPTL